MTLQQVMDGNGKTRLQARLSQRPILIGLLQLRENPTLIEMAAGCGYDFLIPDLHAGVFSQAGFSESLHALVAAKDILSLVRLPRIDPQAAIEYLDRGADGIVVPIVTTSDQASIMSRAVSSRPGRSLIVTIETVPGVEHAEEILAVEGIDAVLIGPNHLSADLGYRGDFAHPSYAAALSRVERAATENGVVLGTVPHEGYPIEVLVSRGHRLFVLSTDRALLQAAMQLQTSRARAACKRES